MPSAVGPVAAVGLRAIGTGLPHRPATTYKVKPGNHCETSGAVARALVELPASVCRPFTPCIPGTWYTYPTNSFLLQPPYFPQFRPILTLPIHRLPYQFVVRVLRYGNYHISTNIFLIAYLEYILDLVPCS